MGLLDTYTNGGQLSYLKQLQDKVKPVAPKPDPIATSINNNTGYKSPAQVKEDAPPVLNTSGVVGASNGYNKVDAEKRINDMYASQEASRMAQLQAKRDAAIGRLTQQATTIKPYYEQQRATLGGQVQQSRNKFSEFLASRGLSQSGAAAQAEISNQGRLQSGVAGLGQAEADAMSEIEKQKELANQDYAINYDGVQQQIQSDKSNALLNEQRYGDTLQQQLTRDAQTNARADYQDKFNAWLTKTNMGREDTRNGILDTRYNDTTKFNQDVTTSGLTGTYNGNPTIDAKKEEFNKMVQMGQLTGGIPMSQLIAQMAPEQIKSYENLGNRDGGFASAMDSTSDPVQKKIIEGFRNRFLAANPTNPYANTATSDVMVPTLQGKQVESGLLTDAAQRKGLDLSNKLNQLKLDSFPEEQQLSIESAKVALNSGREDLAIKIIEKSQLPEKFKAELAKVYADISQGNRQLDISQQGANTSSGNLALNQSEFKAKKDAGAYDPEMYNLDKLVKKDSLEAKKVSDTVNELNKLYVSKQYDPKTMAEIPVVVGNKDDIARAILAKGLSESNTKYLYGIYGIVTK
jgi:hypothetical protein